MLINSVFTVKIIYSVFTFNSPIAARDVTCRYAKNLTAAVPRNLPCMQLLL